MLPIYLKLALRSLRRNLQFTVLNVLGLAFALAVSLLLLLHVRDEWSFDRFHAHSARVQRVLLHTQPEGEAPSTIYANCPNSVGPVLRDNVVAVEQSARLLLHNFGESAFVRANDQRFVEKMLYWSDPALFKIFSFQSLAGNLPTALDQPNTVVLSRSAAQRYFGTASALGQTIYVDQMEPLTVTGVYEDLPGNSTLDAQLIGSFASVKWANANLTWDNASFETWLLLRPDAQPRQVETQIATVVNQNVPKEQQWFTLSLQALPEAHLGSASLDNSYTSRLGDPQQVNILAGLALAILLIACFNYMNLATAQSQLRFREVGINKTLGAARAQLSTRFFAETGLLVGISMGFALILLALALPVFNNLVGKNLPFTAIFQGGFLASILGVGAIVTLISGAYPALFLSSFSPKNLLQPCFAKTVGQVYYVVPWW